MTSESEVGRVAAVDGAQGAPHTIGTPAAPRRAWRAAASRSIRWRTCRIADVDVIADEANGPIAEEAVNATRMPTEWLVDSVFSVPAILGATDFIGTEDRGHTRECRRAIGPACATPTLRAAAGIRLSRPQHRQT